MVKLDVNKDDKLTHYLVVYIVVRHFLHIFPSNFFTNLQNSEEQFSCHGLVYFLFLILQRCNFKAAAVAFQSRYFNTSRIHQSTRLLMN